MNDEQALTLYPHPHHLTLLSRIETVPGSEYKEVMPISPLVLKYLELSAQLRQMGAPGVWMGLWQGMKNGKKVILASSPSLDRYAAIEETAEKAGNALQVIADLRELGLVYSRVESLLKDMSEEEMEQAAKDVGAVILAGTRQFLSEYVDIQTPEVKE